MVDFLAGCVEVALGLVALELAVAWVCRKRERRVARDEYRREMASWGVSPRVLVMRRPTFAQRQPSGRQ